MSLSSRSDRRPLDPDPEVRGHDALDLTPKRTGMYLGVCVCLGWGVCVCLELTIQKVCV
jgi:hypothetical protein